ncbi:MAG: hypothetical protein ABWZ66_11065 [Pyrinomonadaceae bacterium]
MRLKLTMIFIALLFVFGNAGTARATDPDCNSAGQIHGIYYMSCFARNSGETDDTLRIRRAVNAIPSGKLIFNEGDYTVSDTIDLHGNLFIEGTSANTLVNSIPTSSHIRLTVANKAIFKIGEGIFDVVIRDLGLSASSTTGTIGIQGEGAYPAASAHFEFKNLRFTGFNWGIKVRATDSGRNFQFDNVKLDHSLFEGCLVGVYVDSYNSGWQISSIEFVAGTGAYGVWFENVTYSTINSMIGNGAFSGTTPLAESLIYVKEHANLSIQNCVSEGFKNDIKVEGNSPNNPIQLISNFFQDKVEIENASVLSTGNQFGVQVGSAQAPQPVAKGYTRVTSVGDKFCSEGASNCSTGGWVLQNDAVLLFGSYQTKNSTAVPTFMNSYLNIENDLPFESLDKPLLSIIAPTYARALLKLGQSNYNYTLSRSGTNGWLTFEGNQGAPYRGYSFDGPVKLPTYTVTTLPTVLAAGELSYCSNCQAGTSPCAAGTGGGALALSNGSSWVCK